MNARRRLLAAAGGLFAAQAVRAQVPARKLRLGILWSGSGGFNEDILPGMIRALAALGYEVGRNLELDVQVGSDGLHSMPGLAAQLVARKPDIVFTQGTPATRAIANASREIPVITSVADPVGSGFARTLARPGGNVTGLSQGAPEVAQKTLEILRLLVPRLARLAILRREGSFDVEFARHMEHAAAAARIEPVAVTVRDSGLLRTVAGLRAQSTPAAYFAMPIDEASQRPVAAEALHLSIATATPDEAAVERGLLLNLTAAQLDLYERSAALIDRIARGAKPADTPFEYPLRYATTLNRATAAGLKLTIPAEVLLRVDRLVG
jgi:putative ABC transport system substrate-binding protein